MRFEDYLVAGTAYRFSSYGLDVWHCDRCHRVVRTYDSDKLLDKLDMLAAHRAFNCATEPVVPVAWSAAG